MAKTLLPGVTSGQIRIIFTRRGKQHANQTCLTCEGSKTSKHQLISYQIWFGHVWSPCCFWKPLLNNILGLVSSAPYNRSNWIGQEILVETSDVYMMDECQTVSDAILSSILHETAKICLVITPCAFQFAQNRFRFPGRQGPMVWPGKPMLYTILNHPRNHQVMGCIWAL